MTYDHCCVADDRALDDVPRAMRQAVVGPDDQSHSHRGEAPLTPFALVDTAILDANLRAMQRYCDRHSLGFRPHVKTHKTIEIARRQMALGAVGLACQRLGEAELLSEPEEDVAVCFNLLGEERLRATSDLAQRVELSVVIDSQAVAHGLSAAGGARGRGIGVWVECDAGHGRTGVQDVASTVHLAQEVSRLPGIEFRGLAVYPTPRAGTWFDDAVEAVAALDLAERVGVSVGGTPEAELSHLLGYATEVRAGTYAMMDLDCIRTDCATLADCALTIEATCVSRPTGTRAVIDAGSKAIGLERTDLGDGLAYGVLKDRPSAIVSAMSEEHGVLTCADHDLLPEVGERVSVVPSHCCYAINLHDVLWIADDAGAPTSFWRVIARNSSH